MAEYFLLLIACLICWYFSYEFISNDFFAPVPLIFLGFTISIILAIVGIPYWNHYSLSPEVVSIVMIGFSGVLLGGYIISRIKISNKSRSSHAMSAYETPTWKYVIILVIASLAVILRIIETIQIGSDIGIGVETYADLARELRNRTSSLFSTNALTSDIGFSFLEKQLEKITNMSGFVAAYLLSRGMAKRSSRDSLWAGVILIVCFSLQIAGGARAMLFYWIIVFFVTLSLQLCHRKDKWTRKQLSRRFLKGGVLTAIACTIFMYYAGSLVGRVADGYLVDYVSFYFGGSVPSLQIVSDANFERANDGVVETFYGVSTFLFKQGFISELPIYSLAWVDCGGHQSNVFTIFGAYYVGFGLPGVFVFAVLSTMVVDAVYRVAQARMSPPTIVLAGLLCAYAFDFARVEFIFSRLMSTTWIANLILLYLVVSFLTRRVSLRRGYELSLRNKVGLAEGVSILGSSSM